MRRLSSCLLFLLNLSLVVGFKSVCGQNNPYHLPDMYQGRILSWNSFQGLSQSATTAIVQDPLGFIWIGTQDGLNRFDGSHFTVFKHQINDERSLSGNSINCLLVDPLGGVLVGTDNGVSRYDVKSKSFSRLFFNKNPNARLSVTALYVDNRGVFLFGTSDGCLYEYNPLFNNYRKFKILKDPDYQDAGYVSAIIPDGEKRWVVTKNGLHLYENGGFQWRKNQVAHSDSAYSNMIVGADWLNKDELLLATFGDGAYKYHLASSSFSRYIDLKKYVNIEFGNGIVNCLLVDKDQNVWLGTDNGFLLKRKGAKEPEIFHPDNKQGLSSKNIRTLFQDRAGNIWIGTWNGLSVLPKQNSPFYTVPVFDNVETKFVHNSVLAILVDSKKRLWIGTDNQGVACFDMKTGKTTQYNTANSKISSNNIMTLTEDLSGKIWIGTWGVGFSIFDPQSGRFESLLNTVENPKLLTENIIQSVVASSNGVFFVATEQGVDMVNPLTKEVLTKNTALKSLKGKCYQLTFDVIGTLWIGSETGVYKFQPKTNELTEFKSSMPITKVRSILCKNGVLWVGTRGDGLFKVDVATGKALLFNEQHGLSNNVIYSLLADQSNRIWMSTNYGLNCFSISDNRVQNYFEVDGLQSNEFNSGASFVDENGWMFFGGIGGVTFLNPKEFGKQQKIKPTLFIQRIKYDGVDAYPDLETAFTQMINTSYQTKSISIDFGVLHNLKAIPYQYSWKLNGFSDEWSVPSKSGLVTFTNLSPGDYTLEVRVSEPNNSDSLGDYTLRLSIEAPFWMKWSFWLVALVALAAVVFFVQKRRIYRIERVNRELEEKIAQRTEKLRIATEIAESKSQELEEENKMKTRFFSIIAHDIKNPLWGINQISETLVKNLNNQIPEEYQNKMMQINNASKNLGSLLENLLTWASAQSGRIHYQPQKVNVFSLVDDVVDFYEGFSTAKKIGIENRIDPELFVLADKHSMQVVFQNLISNAIKFSFPSSNVLIGSKETETMVEISITDSGVGIDEAKLQTLFDITTLRKTSGTQNEQGTGLGLLLCKEFVTKNNGTIHVSSEPNKGTTFVISLPKIELS